MLPMRQPKTKSIQESIQASIAVSPAIMIDKKKHVILAIDKRKVAILDKKEHTRQHEGI